MDIANNKQNELTEKATLSTSKIRPRSIIIQKEKRIIGIIQWHFLKKEKWYLKLLKQELFSLTLREYSKKKQRNQTK